MKYKARQIQMGQDAGKWAVYEGRRTYFEGTITTDQREAEILALQMTAQWHRDQMDKAHRALEKMDAVHEDDPYGYLA